MGVGQCSALRRRASILPHERADAEKPTASADRLVAYKEVGLSVPFNSGSRLETSEQSIVGVRAATGLAQNVTLSCSYVKMGLVPSNWMVKPIS